MKKQCFHILRRHTETGVDTITGTLTQCIKKGQFNKELTTTNSQNSQPLSILDLIKTFYPLKWEDLMPSFVIYDSKVALQ